MTEPRIYTLIGRAGCGKGTQAKLLVEKFGLIYVGSGELLRRRGERSDFTGRKMTAVLNSGELMPTALVFMLWMEQLEEIKESAGPGPRGIVFDGLPRKLEEERLLAEALAWYEWDKNFKAILIDLPRPAAFERLAKRRQCAQCGQLIPFVGAYKEMEKCDKCGGELVARQDDTPEAINQRLDLFDREVLPVLEEFAAQGALVTVDGEQPINRVFEEILQKIE